MPSLRTTTKIVLLPLCWTVGILNLACSATEPKAGDPVADVQDMVADSDFTPDTDIADPPNTIPEDARWGLAGDIAITAGLPDADTSMLVLEVRSDGTSCLIPADIIDTAVVDAPPEPGYGWWTLTVSPNAEPPCRWVGPTTFTLGLVDPDPVLDVEAAPQGITLETTYGVIVDVNAAPVLVGVAGTAEQFAETAPRVTEAPLDDGIYELITLYGIPLE